MLIWLRVPGSRDSTKTITDEGININNIRSWWVDYIVITYDYYNVNELVMSY
jgi:hypothetical protein